MRRKCVRSAGSSMRLSAVNGVTIIPNTVRLVISFVLG